MTVLLGLVAVGLGGTLALAAVIHAVEQTTAEGQARWLAFVAPEALRMPAEQQLGYVAGFAQMGRLNRNCGRPFHLTRVNIPSGCNRTAFLARVSGAYSAYKSVSELNNKIRTTLM